MRPAFTLPLIHGDTRLTEWDIATGSVLGGVPALIDSSAPVVGPDVSPLAAIERAVLPALLRPPCLVSFSGGMDSSFVLAVATHTARRHGIADPVPVSWHFSHAPAADESARQVAVLAELGIVERVVLQAGDDLDLVGPVAAEQLHRYGVLYPANLHLHVPILQLCSGGSLLTGIGGDQVLSAWTPHRSTVRSHVRGAVPVAVRARRAHHRRTTSWLRSGASRELLRRRLAEARVEPSGAASRLVWQMRRRNLCMAVQNLSAVGRDHAVSVTNPLLDSGFHRSLIRMTANSDEMTREEVLRLAADGRLPDAAWRHRPKAWFGDVFARRHTEDFIRGRPTPLFTDLVDPGALAAAWARSPFPTGSALLLQSVWLNSVSARSRDEGPRASKGGDHDE